MTMINLCRTEARHHDRRHRRDVWRTFGPLDRADPFADGFGALDAIDEHRLPPTSALSQKPRDDTDVVTYVREGAVTYDDSLGRSGVIHAGEFQRVTVGRGLRHSAANASRAHWAHVFYIRLRPLVLGLESSCEQKRFSAAERRGALCVIASPDARRGSLRVHQDAVTYSALLERGQHVVHELGPERAAWLHIVHGEVTLGEFVLTTGDGAAITGERAVSLTARAETEILLFDVVAGRAREAPAS
ncbi:MAG TPA: pirin family protein [Kofleriaceae bacterium]|jgi:redox-sensitive bicupin YhaK (pirin superfamily)